MDANALKALLAPSVVGVCEALKSAGVPAKLLPLVSIVLGGIGGLGIGLAFAHMGADLVGDVLTGCGAGAIGTGGYALVTGIGSTTTPPPVVNVTTTTGSNQGPVA